MLHEERERTMDAVLARYEHLGATLVSDDRVLGLLLRSLQLVDATGDLGEHPPAQSGV